MNPEFMTPGLGAWPAEAGEKNDVGLLEKLSW
jgi:hypothetical protein